MPLFDPGISELLNNFTDVSLVVSPALRIVKAHGPTDVVCGFSPDLLEGKQLHSLFTTDSAKVLESHMTPLRARVQRAVGLNATASLELLPLLLNKLEVSSHSGTTLVHLSILPHRNASIGTGGYYYFVVLKDVSYTQALEKRQNAFLSMVNHELRTPLNGIIGLSESLKFDEKDITRRRRFDMLLNSAHCMLKLIKGVIRIADLKGNAADLNLSLVNVNDVVEELCEVISHLVDKRGRKLKKDSVDIITQLDAKLPLVDLDKEMVYQGLDAVVNNALKFTEHGSVTIRTQKDTPTGGILVSVQDTGHGITPDFLSRVFESFLQEDERPDMRQFEGLGLGLTLAKEVCGLHGGKIWVQSEVGTGSTFFLVFPPSAKAMKVISMKQRNLAANFHSTDSSETVRSIFSEQKSVGSDEVLKSLQPPIDIVESVISEAISSEENVKLNTPAPKCKTNDHIDTSFLNRPRCYEPLIPIQNLSLSYSSKYQQRMNLHYDYYR